jgi:hypothetical protein
MKYEYAGGVMDHERPIIERFENEVLPYVMRHGPLIGEMAMQGDMDAELVIRFQRAFCEGDPAWRVINFKKLCEYLKIVERKIQ